MTDQEINEAVARKLGWTYSEEDKHWHEPVGDGIGNCWDFPDFANNIAAAWEIVETVGKPSINFHLSYGADMHDPFKIHWDCVIGDRAAIADTAPMAICLAFLKLP